MKFSIKAVFAITTIAALAVFTANNLVQQRKLLVRISIARAELAELLISTNRGQARIELLQTHLESQQRSSLWFDQMSEGFAEAMAEYGRLSVEDPNEFSFIRIPSFNEQGKLNRVWRVFAPENSNYELQIGSTVTDSDRLDNPVFEPPFPLVCNLPAGESVISFCWDTTGGLPRLICRLNGMIACESELSMNLQGTSSSMITCEDEIKWDFKRNPLKLFELRPSQDLLRIELSIKRK